MMTELKEIFEKLSVLLTAALAATGYLTAVAWFGLMAYDVAMIFAGVSIFIGLLWATVGGIYIPWVIARTWRIWQKLEILAETAELPIAQRHRAMERIRAIA